MAERYDRDKVLAAIEERAAKLSPKHRDAFMAQLVKAIMTGDLYRPARDPEPSEAQTDDQPWMPTPEQADIVDITKMPGYAAGRDAERARVLAIVEGHRNKLITNVVADALRDAIAAPDAAADDEVGS